MKVLKATLSEKKELEGIYNQGAELRFIEDIHGNWVVNITVLSDDRFLDIKEKLEQLPLIDFEPKQYENL